MKDRRSESRCAVRWPMRAGHPTAGCAFGTTLDIAASSASFLLPEQYQVDDRVEVEIAAAPALLLRCTARILRTQHHSDAGTRYAVKLEDFCDRDKEILLRMIRTMERTDPPQPFSRIVVTHGSS